jgi:hypothetical protein
MRICLSVQLLSERGFAPINSQGIELDMSKERQEAVSQC